VPTPAPHPSPTSLLAVARLAATRAGDHARCNGLRRQDVNTISRHDVKHKLDVECQTIATQTILAAFPGHAILGEETAGAERPAPAGVEWIIDPIDGTVNFFHGLPYWCCSVAARLDGVTQAGFVYAPEMGLAFEAASDGPALCNGQPLQTSACTDLARALVHTGTDKADGTSRSSRFFDALAMVVQRPRIMGAAALDICFVAQGASDGYFEHGIFIWDVAAAALILARAGGTSEILKAHGGYRLAFLASNGHLHSELKTRLLQVM
jgi:myo-inositol-1(or 4)-monophosphatase